jgi:predicted porin
MKKSLIALAALAAVGVASAQSSVTLSGTLDTSFEKSSGGVPWSFATGRNGVSNITLSGNEDLGGGLKASFYVSTFFDSTYGGQTSQSTVQTTPTNAQNGGTTSSNTTSLGSNGIFVGLSGDFGKVRVGRPVSILANNSLTANPILNNQGDVVGFAGVGGFTANNTLYATPGTGSDVHSNFVANGVQYYSPNVNGFTFQLEYAPSEQTNVRYTAGVGVKYENGPLAVTYTNYRGVGVNTTTSATAAAPWIGDNTMKINQLGAAYDFGVAKAFLTYARDTGADPANSIGVGFTQQPYKALLLGVSAPVGASGSVWGQFGQSQSDSFVDTTKGRTYGLGYKYAMSKRTSVYAQLGRRNLTDMSLTGSTGKNGYGFGITHNF